jgi:hypothetical protein
MSTRIWLCGRLRVSLDDDLARSSALTDEAVDSARLHGLGSILRHAGAT